MAPELAVVLWISGFVLVGLGLLIRNGYPELISGYDPETAADPEMLVSFVGRWTIYLGIVLIASGFVPARHWGGWFAPVFVAVTSLVSLRMVVGASRYG